MCAVPASALHENALTCVRCRIISDSIDRLLSDREAHGSQNILSRGLPSVQHNQLSKRESPSLHQRHCCCRSTGARPARKRVHHPSPHSSSDACPMEQGHERTRGSFAPALVFLSVFACRRPLVRSSSSSSSSAVLAAVAAKD